MSGDGSADGNFVANIAIVSLCSLVSTVEKKERENVR